MKKTKKLTIFNKDTFWGVADFETFTKDSETFKRLGHTGVGLSHLRIFERATIDNYGRQHFSTNTVYEKLDYDIDSFMERVKSFNDNLIIYFHNLNFDGVFIWKWFLRNKHDKIWYPGFNNNQFSKKSERVIIFKNGRDIYYIEWRFRKKFGKYGFKGDKLITIRFQCSLKLLSAGLEALGKNLTDRNGNPILKHDEEDYKLMAKLGIMKYENEKDRENFYHLLSDNFIKMHPVTQEKFIEYIKRDTYIQSKNLVILFNNLCFNKMFLDVKEKHPNIFNFLTIGSITRTFRDSVVREYDFKNNTNIFKGLKVYSKEMFELTRMIYTGGFNQFNNLFVGRDFKIKGLFLDINSSYPYQMTKLLPYGELLKEKPEEEYLEYVKVSFKQAIIKEEYKNFPVFKIPRNHIKYGKGYRYTTSISNVENWYLKQEFDYFKEFYDFIELKEDLWYTKAAYFLADFMNETYLQRLRAKCRNKGQAQTLKILMNSLYGGMGMAGDYPEIIYLKKEDYARCISEAHENDNMFLYKDEYYLLDTIPQRDCYDDLYNNPYILKAYKCSFNDKKCKKFNNMLIPATITAYGRIQLFHCMKQIGFDKVIYCDTDSMFIAVTNSLNINTEDEITKEFLRQNHFMNEFIDENRLGGWKIEGWFDCGFVKKAKSYVFKWKGKTVKSASAGINNLGDYDLFNVLRDHEELKEGKKTIVEDGYGCYLTKIDVKINIGRQ